MSIIEEDIHEIIEMKRRRNDKIWWLSDIKEIAINPRWHIFCLVIGFIVGLIQ